MTQMHNLLLPTSYETTAGNSATTDSSPEIKSLNAETSSTPFPAGEHKNTGVHYNSRVFLHIFFAFSLLLNSLGSNTQRTCSLLIKHANIWYELAYQNVSLALILEDDAIFVPFFKEKFARMINTAFLTGVLRPNQTCVRSTPQKLEPDQRSNQNPMIVIGTCFHLHGSSFPKHSQNATPVLSTAKLNASRCTHAYLLTSCSAEALTIQIQRQKNSFFPADFMQNYLFRLSPTLQSFWLDPPLAYQGNQVIDIDEVPTFKMRTH